jgi:peptide chain release factor subunit 1
VPVITEDAIRELASIRGEGAPVTSCYLDVDGRRLRRHQDVEQELDTLLRVARQRANGTQSVHEDLRRIESFVRAGIDRSRTRGLAFFSCSAGDVWRVVELPVPVRSRVIFNTVPALGQLEAAVQELTRFGVLLADRQRARMFVFEAGDLVERSERFHALGRDYDVRGEKERGDVSGHVDALAQQHLRAAADHAFTVFQERQYEHLWIGAPDEIAHELEQLVHPYLRDRLCGRVDVRPGASDEDVRRSALASEVEHERHKEAALVAKLRDAVGAGDRGVTGLPPVLAALAQHRIDHLLVSDGYSAPGWVCDGCGTLATKGPRCKACTGTMIELEDVVEEAVDRALAERSRVEVCRGNADLDVLGRIGALLRF